MDVGMHFGALPILSSLWKMNCDSDQHSLLRSWMSKGISERYRLLPLHADVCQLAEQSDLKFDG
jgi:hypothetical protein